MRILFCPADHEVMRTFAEPIRVQRPDSMTTQQWKAAMQEAACANFQQVDGHLKGCKRAGDSHESVSYTHLRAHETSAHL
eukprot:13468290-Alexandrium_andersonii.AAC.1